MELNKAYKITIVLKMLIDERKFKIYDLNFCKDIYVIYDEEKFRILRVVKGYTLGEGGSFGKWILEINDITINNISQIEDDDIFRRILLKDDSEGVKNKEELIFNTYDELIKYINNTYRVIEL